MMIQQHNGMVMDATELQQGFAKHYERRGGRGVGLRQKRGVLVCMAAPKPQVYIGEREGAAPPLGFPPQGVRPALDGTWGGGQEGERVEAPTRWALRPIWTRVCPLPLSHAPGPWWGGAPAHLGLVPSHTWPMQPSGANDPTW